MPLLSLLGDHFNESIKQEAMRAYQEGILSDNYLKRNQDFNRALTLLIELEKNVGVGSAELYTAIGNVFFQLDEYPFALLYYERALNQDPFQKSVEKEIIQLREMLHLPAFKTSPLTRWNPFSISSFYEKEMILFWMLMFSFFTFSFLLIVRKQWLKWLNFLFGTVCSVFFFILVLQYYFSPIQGIIIESTGLYQAPDYSSNLIEKQPTLRGSKISVLESMQGGQWLKILDENDHIGYINYKSVRIIN